MKMRKTTAIILAAGQGKRMNSAVRKQYLLIAGKPVLYYSLKAFEESLIDDIVLVAGNGEIDFCQKEIVEKYGISKVRTVTAGGKERYHSVAYGLAAVKWDCDYVFIHDGARPFINASIIERAQENQLNAANVSITDDAMVVEYFMQKPIKLIEGSYENIKITTPEDLKMAELFLNV